MSPSYFQKLSNHSVTCTAKEMKVSFVHAFLLSVYMEKNQGLLWEKATALQKPKKLPSLR